jgi:predicted component of viral defense system (DUF524 family)
MSGQPSSVELSFLERDGRHLGSLKIAAVTPGVQPAIVVLADDEARRWHEQPVQLLEGVSYDYELRTTVPGGQLRVGAARPSRLYGGDVERGRIEPGAYTGVLTLVLENSAGVSLSAIALEVRSVKLGYRDDYRNMLDDISSIAMQLLVDLRAPSSTWLAPISNTDPPSLVQRFFFIRKIVMGGELRGAVARVSANPHEVMRHETSLQSIQRRLRPSGRLASQLSAGTPRIKVPKDHPIFGRAATLPLQVIATDSVLTRDTPENRFVKFALSSFASTISEIEDVLRRSENDEYRQVIAQCREVRDEVVTLSRQPPLMEIDGNIKFLPLGSAVLQRRSGYREILKAWLQYNLSARLNWDGGEDVYLGGKRDVATLYEYWVFFQLLATARKVFEFSVASTASLLEAATEGLTLRLKSGNNLAFYGKTRSDGKLMNVRFSYNRSFTRRSNPTGDAERSYPLGGSWTRTMRPDYTISFWPEALAEDDAESSEMMMHLHFDAKYRIDRLTQIFGGSNLDDTDGLDDQFEAGGSKTAKRDDLLKMHAYRDAIRRSVSAFVIYPGEMNLRWREYEEILPGLGAITLSPGNPEGCALIECFLTDSAELAMRRFEAGTAS